jgi:hypothetical protein
MERDRRNRIHAFGIARKNPAVVVDLADVISEVDRHMQ